MRLLVSFFAAVCMSVALFSLMRYMISGEVQRIDKPPPGVTVNLVRIGKSGQDPETAPDSAPPALRPYRRPAKPPAAIPEPALAAPSPLQPPALRAVLPELEPIVPNGGPYLGFYEKPVKSVPSAVPKPVQPPKTIRKSRTRPRQAANIRKEKAVSIPSRPATSTASGTVAGGGAGSKAGPPLTEGSTGGPGLEDEVIALLKLAPEYPRKAARAGKEGWVKLEFTITRQGSVTDAEVVDARPRRLFDRAALRAIRKWRFKPKITRGKAVPRRATQVIEFKLASR